MVGMSWNKEIVEIALLEKHYEVTNTAPFARTPDIDSDTQRDDKTFVTTRYPIIVGLLAFDWDNCPNNFFSM